MDNTTDNNIIDKLPKKNLDIQQIIDKIKNLPIDDKDKAAILEQMKSNIMNPSKGENKSLDDIQDKYSSINMPSSEDDHRFNLKPISNNQSQNNQDKYQNMDQSQPMSVAQFEILKNKLDSLQYELIDLLRHVKDYTQRYMNAVRQQDLEKITEYINGLFEVDKTLKETQELAKSAPVEEEAEPEDRKSLITKATSGIKNFFGNIGNNVSGITDLVKNTADIANGYLTKKVIPSSKDTSNISVSNSNSTNTIGNTTTNTSTSRNKNIISVDEYISDMNKLEAMNNISTSNIKSNIPTISNANIISSSSNNINSLGENSLQITKPVSSNIIPKAVESNETTETTETTETPETPETPETTEITETPETPETPEDLEGALKKLNDTMNDDIEKTVNPQPLQTGGKRTKLAIKNKKEYNLNNKIRLLKLKLTKNKLQNQLKENKTIIVSRHKKKKSIKKSIKKHNSI